jgi:hypothetical protein
MKDTLKIQAIAGAVALTLASGVSVGGEMMGGSTGNMKTPSFSELDANSDGQISQDEAAGSQALQQHWQSADTNGDQKIDRTEFSAFEEQKPGYKTKEY